MSLEFASTFQVQQPHVSLRARTPGQAQDDGQVRDRVRLRASHRRVQGHDRQV